MIRSANVQAAVVSDMSSFDPIQLIGMQSSVKTRRLMGKIRRVSLRTAAELERKCSSGSREYRYESETASTIDRIISIVPNNKRYELPLFKVVWDQASP
jgi:hypothetical protein